ncbi:hypothetical protein PAERUG_P45_London_17_VIM_2_12_12_04045 [Pseudomonas aeruginosa]|nr:hypothetical protein PAERUG_P45_London_17_VIM_2_12_12_04045 [Pseudomonas aeruginosa]CRR89421.1 hypothetical protein PAERUG_P5_London_26_VIM_2_01_09_02895 [Pseudomonas aeruginosa]
MVADRGHHLGTQQVVHEGVAGLLVGRVDRHRDHVEPQRRAFLRRRVAHFHAVVGLLGAGRGLQDVAGETDHHADLAVGQVADVLRGVEVADVRAHLQQRRLGLLVVVGLLAVVWQAEVVEGDGQQLGAVVQHRHPALAQFLHVFGLEEDIPGVQRRVVAEHRLDLRRVVADAGGAPEVGEAVLVARIVDLQGLEQHRVEVLPVGQLGLVQLLQGAGLDLLGHEVVRREYHVVAGLAGHQLAVEGLVAVVDVVGGLDAGFLGEVRHGFGSDVFGPVVDLQVVRGEGCAAAASEGEEGEGSDAGLHCCRCPVG